MKETFEEFLKANISWFDYEHLNEHLGESQKMTTMIIEDPSRGEVKHLSIITKLINKWNPGINTDYLIHHFNFGIKENQLT